MSTIAAAWKRPMARTYCHPDLFEPVSIYLFHNNGDGTFSDASELSGIQAVAGKGLGVAFADFNLDGWIDVAVANDSHPQFLFKNDGDGTFSEVALLAGTAYDEHGKEFAGMGIDFGDLDNDGLPDLVVTALPQEKYAVFYNAGDEMFEYRSGESNVGRASQFYSGWGMSIFDYDNDGRRDLFFANGHVMDNIEQSRRICAICSRRFCCVAKGADSKTDPTEQESFSKSPGRDEEPRLGI